MPTDEELAKMGSSPLARGPHTGTGYSGLSYGLIPARAGTTGGDVFLLERSGAHPRSRGDHHSMPANPPPLMGSSPLARGPPPESLGA